MSIQYKMAAFFVATVIAMIGTAAHAANCESFGINLKNLTTDEIKVTKLEYEDNGSYKTENMFGLDGYQKIEPGKTIHFTRNLGGIGGEPTNFKVTYKHHLGGTVWGSDIVLRTTTFTCTDHGSKDVNLNK